MAYAVISSAQTVPDLEPIPRFYQEPGPHPNRDYVNQHFSEHIDPFTGKLQLHYVDLFIPGNGGLDLKVQRSYSSLNENLGEPVPYGDGWTMHFGRVLRKSTVAICDFNQSPTVNPVVELPDGSRQILYVGTDGASFISTARWKATCATGGNGLIVHAPDGTQYEMTEQGITIGSPSASQQVWHTSRIVDRNGNTLSFTYDTYPLFKAVKTITGSDGRSVTFNYTTGASGSGLLTSVTDGARTWTYVYKAVPGYLGHAYYLIEVQRPDGASWKYDYNETLTANPGSYSLRKLTYPTGGQLDYTYGFVNFATNPVIPRSTVVTQKSGDNGSWTYAYRPATLLYNPNATTPDPLMFDETTVQAPNGTTTYWHIGYNSVSSGSVWSIGLLAARNIGGQENQALAWNSQTISNQTNLRPGGTLAFDNAVAAPMLAIKEINRNGQVYRTEFSSFDAYGNPGQIAETGTDSRTTTLTYFTDPMKWIIRQKKDETTSSTGTITRSFDLSGNLLTETRYGVATNWTYYASGDVATRTDARNNTINFGNYKRGIPQTETHPESVAISRVVSDQGNITSQTDGESVTTTYQYDGLNRLTGITHPVGNAVTAAWTANTRTVTRGSYREVTTCDAFGRVARVDHTDTARSETISQTYQYNAVGQRIFASYPNALVGTRFERDMLDRLTAIKHVYDPAGGTFDAQRLFSYVNNTSQVQNERGYVTTHTYRGYGDPDQRDLMVIASPEPNTSVTITRNGLGQITGVTQDGVARTFGYDTRYFLTSKVEPETGTTTYGRDAVGNMTSRQVSGAGGTSPVTSFGYDGRNRLTSITYPAGTPSVTRTYYKDDLLKSIDNGVARRDYVYGPNKRLTQETLAIGAQSFVAQYAHDGNDALNVMTYGSGKTVTYSPDAFGRPTQAGPYVTSVSHHPSGQVSGITYANGVQTNLQLNARRWPASLNVTRGAALFNTAYGYDGVGNVTSISDSIDGSYNRTLTYDAIDRLKLANASAAWGSGGYEYDGRGNITRQIMGSFTDLTYTYDSNRLRTISGVGTLLRTFGYDVYGNVTEDGGGRVFAYNDALTMTCARCGQANQITYAYDGAGMRVSMQQSSGTTYFVYGAAGNLLWEKASTGTVKEYVYLDGKQIAVRQQ